VRISRQPSSRNASPSPIVRRNASPSPNVRHDVAWGCRPPMVPCPCPPPHPRRLAAAGGLVTGIGGG
jgi:hypothetical protein